MKKNPKQRRVLIGLPLKIMFKEVSFINEAVALISTFSIGKTAKTLVQFTAFLGADTAACSIISILRTHLDY